MNLQDYKGVFVFAQQLDCEISGVSFELIGKAKELAAELATDVTAVVLGKDVKKLADKLAAFGADKVIVVDVFVYAPESNKRNLIRTLEASFYTIRILKPEEMASDEAVKKK